MLGLLMHIFAFIRDVFCQVDGHHPELRLLEHAGGDEPVGGHGGLPSAEAGRVRVQRARPVRSGLVPLPAPGRGLPAHPCFGARTLGPGARQTGTPPGPEAAAHLSRRAPPAGV
ncbi:hypothetical protein AAFF_G00177840 [Aldrovandia affinis]|uniref:Secreted protein n=1 Tax=Aldrovandia affinis TaxID=143900 RepID=A0AAD7W795_9TELE|nr:hypothetical protein AAFF_G00177840 [Aldrovandia affinis]